MLSGSMTPGRNVLKVSAGVMSMVEMAEPDETGATKQMRRLKGSHVMCLPMMPWPLNVAD